jgi:hypothetical protein
MADNSCTDADEEHPYSDDDEEYAYSDDDDYSYSDDAEGNPMESMFTPSKEGGLSNNCKGKFKPLGK